MKAKCDQILTEAGIEFESFNESNFDTGKEIDCVLIKSLEHNHDIIEKTLVENGFHILDTDFQDDGEVVVFEATTLI